LNIEKWPAIWQPAKSKNKPALRVMEREVPAADGSRVVSRVEVGFTQLGTLSTEEQKMLYVLVKLWEENGKPGTQVFFSTRELARMLKKKGWGTNVIQAITKSLRKLRTIPIEWINSYYDQTKLGAVVVDRRPFTLLGELRVVERRQDGAVNSSQGYFKFDDHVLANLQLNYTKPVCIEEFFKLKSEIAQLIYSHIDLMLFDKGKYEEARLSFLQAYTLKKHPAVLLNLAGGDQPIACPPDEFDRCREIRNTGFFKQIDNHSRQLGPQCLDRLRFGHQPSDVLGSRPMAPRQNPSDASVRMRRRTVTISSRLHTMAPIEIARLRSNPVRS
jgi:hypothetical protein